MRLDSVRGLFGVIGVDGYGLRREIGVVDGIVDRYGDLKARTAVDRCTSNASPHRLKATMRSAHRAERSRWLLTWRLAMAAGLTVVAKLDSLRLAAAENFDWKG